MKKKMSYEKMIEILADGIPLVDTDEEGNARQLTLLPLGQIFTVRAPEWDEDRSRTK